MHLLSTPHGYYWRIRIPSDIRKVVSKTELRYPLQTHSKRKAKYLSGIITGRTQRLFRAIRGDIMTKGHTTLTPDDIKHLVKIYIQDALEAIEDYRLNRPSPRTLEQLEMEHESKTSIAEDAMEASARGDTQFVKHTVDGLLESQGIQIDPDSLAYKKLSFAILDAVATMSDYESKTVYRPNTKFNGLANHLDEQPMEQPETTSELISDVISTWWDEVSPAWTDRTVVEYKRAIKWFKEFLSVRDDIQGVQIHLIDYALMRQYKESLMRIKLSNGKFLSASSVDKYLGVIKALFAWAVRNNHIEVNPAEGLQIGKKASKKRPDEFQDIFELDDLKKLFLSKNYLQNSFKHPWQYWLPLLGLFTGARIEEICQLYVDDIKPLDEVWCIDINQSRDDQSVKTHERRIVPIHPFLLDDLGFVSQYIQKLPRAGRVFPELKRIKYRYSHYATKWFSTYRTKVGIKAKPRHKTFHSFRHTFATTLAIADVPDFLISQVVGHANQGQTTGRYIKRFEPKMLLEKAILKLNFVEEIGLSILVR